MKIVFQNAIRIAFTGTPVFGFEKNTFREFGKKPLYILHQRLNRRWIYLIREYIEQAKELEGSIADDIDALIEGEDVKITRSELRKYLNYSR